MGSLTVRLQCPFVSLNELEYLQIVWKDMEVVAFVMYDAGELSFLLVQLFAPATPLALCCFPSSPYLSPMRVTAITTSSGRRGIDGSACGAESAMPSP